MRAGEAAGVIFFSDNIVSLDQIRGVAQELQAAAMASPIPVPLLLLTDQEGGQVRRAPASRRGRSGRLRVAGGRGGRSLRGGRAHRPRGGVGAA
ncbi:hypothetical protein [Tomitella cavernea]|uniref:Glycoside hydrolase family 3 N-terminal domain-containing protein n=1 Tax=Tomitella cavernea TaxID=1387982 RepID=A0ABP9C9J3_9ACTN